jgi:hypothetical protein
MRGNDVSDPTLERLGLKKPALTSLSYGYVIEVTIPGDA